METKTVYSYSKSGVYISPKILDSTDRSPSGAWNIPAGCTEIAPPAKQSDYNRVFANGVWSQVAIPVEPASPPPTLDALKQQKLSAIDALTRQHITSGFVSTAKGTANTYDSTEEDQMTFATMYAASRSADFTTNETYHGQIPIRAVPAGQSEKVVLQHNASEMQKLIDDLALHIGGCKQIGWTLQSQVSSATTIEDLATIAWKTF